MKKFTLVACAIIVIVLLGLNAARSTRNNMQAAAPVVVEETTNAMMAKTTGFRVEVGGNPSINQNQVFAKPSGYENVTNKEQLRLLVEHARTNKLAKTN